MQCALFVLTLYCLNQILCEIEDLSAESSEGEDTMASLSDMTSDEEELARQDTIESSDSEDSNQSLSGKDSDEKALHYESAEEKNFNKESLNQFESELLSGNTADLFGTNPHYKQPIVYQDLGRRFVPQYPYNYISKTSKSSESTEELIPIAAPPELVLAVAKKSALLQASEPENPTDEVIRKKILRTGEYWNDVWKEDIDPKRLLRSVDRKKNYLETVKLKIRPDSKFYDIIKRLKQISPRIVYVINKDTRIKN